MFRKNLWRIPFFGVSFSLTSIYACVFGTKEQTANRHVAANVSILTKDYVDELEKQE